MAGTPRQNIEDHEVTNLVAGIADLSQVLPQPLLAYVARSYLEDIYLGNSPFSFLDHVFVQLTTFSIREFSSKPSLIATSQTNLIAQSAPVQHRTDLSASLPAQIGKLDAEESPIAAVFAVLFEHRLRGVVERLVAAGEPVVLMNSKVRAML